MADKLEIHASDGRGTVKPNAKGAYSPPMTLSKDEREAAIEKMARAMAHAHYAKRFELPIDNPHVVMNAEANWRAMSEREATAALDAVLPLIERAVAQRFSELATQLISAIDDQLYPDDPQWAELRALADEVRG